MLNLINFQYREWVRATLQMHQIRFRPLGELTVLPRPSSWIFRGLLLRGGEERVREGRGGEGREGRERGGRGPIRLAGPGPRNTLRRLCVYAIVGLFRLEVHKCDFRLYTPLSGCIRLKHVDVISDCIRHYEAV